MINNIHFSIQGHQKIYCHIVLPANLLDIFKGAERKISAKEQGNIAAQICVLTCPPISETFYNHSAVILP